MSRLQDTSMDSIIKKEQKDKLCRFISFVKSLIFSQSVGIVE